MPSNRAIAAILGVTGFALTGVLMLPGTPGDADDDGVPDGSDLCNGRIYGSQLYVPSELSDLARTDAESNLEAATGTDWTVTEGHLSAGDCATEGGTAIQVRLTSDVSDAPASVQALAAQVDAAGRESYGVHGAQGEGLWLLAQRGTALGHAVYGYLHRLGARWYFPSPRWEFAPPLTNDIRWTTSEVIEPRWDTQLLQGIGSKGSSLLISQPPFADEADVRDILTHWQIRNRVPLSYQRGGVQNFVTAQSAAICANNRYLAEYPHNAGHATVTCPTPTASDTLTKLDYTFTGDCTGGLPCDLGSDPDCNADGTGDCNYGAFSGINQLFSENAFSQLQTLISTYGADDYRAQYISVAAPDGGDHCDCAKCRNLLRQGPYGAADENAPVSSISDRHFHLANQASMYIADQPGYEQYGVATLAYSETADAPTIPLEPMLVTVSLNTIDGSAVYKTQDDVLDGWRDKLAVTPGLKLGIHWVQMPDPSTSSSTVKFGMPTESLYDYDRNLEKWHRYGFRSLLIEGAHAWGNQGWHWLLSARKAWRNEQGNDLVLEGLTRAFGPPGHGLKVMYDRWWEGYVLSPLEIGASIADVLSVARQVDGDTAKEVRLQEVMYQVEYLRLFLEYTRAFEACGSDYPAFEDATDAILTHLWRTYGSNVQNTAWLHSRIRARLNGVAEYCPAVVSDNWAEWGEGGDRWAPLTPYSYSDIKGILETAQASYPAPPPRVRYRGPPYPATMPVCMSPPCADVTTFQYSIQPADFSVWHQGGVLTFEVEAWTTLTEAVYEEFSLPPMVVDVRTYDGESVLRTSAATGPTSAHETTEIDAGSQPLGSYVVHVDPIVPSGNFYRLHFPYETAAASNTRVHNGFNQSLRWYFHVPAGQTREDIAFHSAGSLAFRDSANNVESPSVSDTWYTLDTTGDDNAVWSMLGVYGAEPLDDIARWSGPNWYSYSAAHAMTQDTAFSVDSADELELCRLLYPARLGTQIGDAGIFEEVPDAWAEFVEAGAHHTVPGLDYCRVVASGETDIHAELLTALIDGGGVPDALQSARQSLLSKLPQ